MMQKRRRLQRKTVAMIGAAGLTIGTWLAGAVLLRGIADLWIITDTITRVDAIIVLGGSYQVRPLAAAELYHRSVANKVLVSQTAQAGPNVVGTALSDTQLNCKALREFGVPENVIGTFGTENKSTRDEAVSLRNWADRNNVLSFAIPVESFGSRRVKWIFGHEFSGKPFRIEVLSFDPPEYNHREWWRTKQGLIAFGSETLKYVYYRVRY
jgi:uncharacterized SAM-binding protein YcdF (DUF218 family)